VSAAAKQSAPSRKHALAAAHAAALGAAADTAAAPLPSLLLLLWLLPWDRWFAHRRRRRPARFN
jgi:hypothetical protein